MTMQELANLPITQPKIYEFCSCRDCKLGGKGLAQLEAVSKTPTPWLLMCFNCLDSYSIFKARQVYITHHEYNRQLKESGKFKCPICKADTYFNDTHFDESMCLMVGSHRRLQ